MRTPGAPLVPPRRRHVFTRPADGASCLPLTCSFLFCATQYQLFDESSLQLSWTRTFQVSGRAGLWCCQLQAAASDTDNHQMGAGLKNMGNTCFLNATLQCLTYVPPLANYALANGHAKFKVRCAFMLRQVGNMHF